MDFRAHLVSWNEIQKWCSILRDKVIESYAPDLIIGLSRGGLVPARILSDSLWIKDLLAIKTEHWGLTATRDGKAVLNDPGKLNLEGRKVLVVDDITDTGQSMKLAYDFVKSRNPKDLKTATMLHIDRSEFTPDFYSQQVSQEQWTWFVFPWNLYEDMDNLLSKVVTNRLDIGQIRGLLKERFDLDIGNEQLEEILRDFVKSGRLYSEGSYYFKRS